MRERGCADEKRGEEKRKEMDKVGTARAMHGPRATGRKLGRLAGSNRLPISNQFLPYADMHVSHYIHVGLKAYTNSLHRRV